MFDGIDQVNSYAFVAMRYTGLVSNVPESLVFKELFSLQLGTVLPFSVSVDGVQSDGDKIAIAQYRV